MNRETILSQLGAAANTDVLVEQNQNVRDIINLMKFKHNKCKGDYDLIAVHFYGGSVRDICKKLFSFCKKNIAYEIESEEMQTVSSPQRILERGYGDCKHYALFNAGVLDALNRLGYNIDWVFRYASYDIFDETPGHVFVVVRNDGQEIWLDPVLSEFDYHKPFYTAIDKNISTAPAKIGGMYYENRKGSQIGLSCLNNFSCGSYSVIGDINDEGIGDINDEGIGDINDEGIGDINDEGIGSVAQTGAIITKVSSVVAAVPVYPVSTILGAAGAVVGFFLQAFGSKYSASTQVRWLTQLFEYYVQANCNSTSDNTVNESNVPTAQKWFAVVLGVPVYDRYRFNSLAGRTGWASVDNSRTARVQDYMNYPEVKTLLQQGAITQAQILQATYIADTLPYSAGCGGWKLATAAPSLIDNTALPATGNYNPTATVQQTGVIPTGTQANFISSWATRFNIPVWVIYAVLGGGVYLLLSGSKKHHK